MFAKLNFPTTVTAAQAVRDVTRIIHDSSSGNADLNNLEFINVLDSELYAGVNSGWSLAGGVTLPTGAVDSTDVYRILQSPCVDTNKVKYAGIYVNCDFSNSGSYNSTTTGWLMAPIIDYGTATQLFCGGYSGTDSSRRRNRAFSPGGNIWIFASPRRLIIFGFEERLGYEMLTAYMEFAENGMTQFYNLVPSGYFFLQPGYDLELNWSSTQAFIRGSSAWQNYDNCQANNLVFPKAIHDHTGRGASRLVSIMYRGAGFESSTNLTYWTSENGTTSGSALGSIATETNRMESYGSNTIEYMLGTYYAVQDYGPDLWSTDLRYSVYNGTAGTNNGSASQFTQAGKYLTAAGVPVVPLSPIAVNVWPASTGLIDFSISDAYITTGQLGVIGDTITFGGDVYYYFTRSGDGAAWAIKRI